MHAFPSTTSSSTSASATNNTCACNNGVRVNQSVTTTVCVCTCNQGWQSLTLGQNFAAFVWCTQRIGSNETATNTGNKSTATVIIAALVIGLVLVGMCVLFSCLNCFCPWMCCCLKCMKKKKKKAHMPKSSTLEAQSHAPSEPEHAVSEQPQPPSSLPLRQQQHSDDEYLDVDDSSPQPAHKPPPHPSRDVVTLDQFILQRQQKARDTAQIAPVRVLFRAASLKHVTSVALDLAPVDGGLLWLMMRDGSS